MDGETRAAQFGDGIAKFRALADTLDPAGKFRASLTLSPFCSAACCSRVRWRVQGTRGRASLCSPRASGLRPTCGPEVMCAEAAWPLWDSDNVTK